MPASVTELSVTGMSCANCARHVTEAIQGVAGVRSAAVNLEQNKAVVRWLADGQPPVAVVIGAVRDAGYDAKELKADAHEQDRVAQRMAGWQINLWIGVLGTIPMMLGE